MNARCYNGTTALTNAVCRGNVKSVKFLLERGADVNVYDYAYGHTVLHITLNRSHKTCFDLLLQSGADVNIEKNQDIIQHFLKKRDITYLDKLIKAGANVNSADGTVCTALMLAAYGYQFPSLKYLRMIFLLTGSVCF